MAQDKHGPNSNAVEVPYFTQQSNVKWVEMQQFHQIHCKQYLLFEFACIVATGLVFVKCFVIA